jgi:putative transposase
MARQLRITYPGAYYHVTTRGNERTDIYKSQRDREKFLTYLESASERYGAVFHAYCLMRNHYHFLLETPQGNLPEIMQHINGAYTTYFNVKRKRAGHLFQGRYKAILVEADEYAAELSRYIHLNPVKVGVVSRPEEYRWSSYCAYIGNSTTFSWLNTSLILGCFAQKVETAHNKYRKFVEDMIGKEYESPLRKTFGSAILGTEAFIEEISQTYIAGIEPDRNLPALRQFDARLLPEEIDGKVKSIFGDNEKLARNASIHICHKYSGVKLKEIGQYFSVRESAITEASRRFQLRMEKDKELREKIKQVKDLLII